MLSHFPFNPFFLLLVFKLPHEPVPPIIRCTFSIFLLVPLMLLPQIIFFHSSSRLPADSDVRVLNVFFSLLSFNAVLGNHLSPSLLSLSVSSSPATLAMITSPHVSAPEHHSFSPPCPLSSCVSSFFFYKP